MRLGEQDDPSAVRNVKGQGKRPSFGFGGAMMMRIRISTLAAFWLLVGSMVLAAATPKPGMKLYVTNSGSGDITVIDLDTLKVVGDIPVGEGVHGAAVQLDGRRLFTTIESDNTLRIIDTATNEIEATIKLTGRPNSAQSRPTESMWPCRFETATAWTLWMWRRARW